MGVLIVDDDDLFRRAVRRALHGDEIRDACTLDEGFRMTVNEQPLVFLLDVHFTGPRSGLDAVPGFQALAPLAEIVIASSSTARPLVRRAESLGCYGYIGKTDIVRAVGFIRAASRRAQARAENYARMRRAVATIMDPSLPLACASPPDARERAPARLTSLP